MKHCLITGIVALLGLVVIPSVRANDIPPGRHLPESIAADSIDPFEYFVRDQDNAKELWIYNSKTRQRVFVYEYDRTIRASLSDDGKYIAIVDNFASNASRIVLFHCSRDLAVKRIETSDIVKDGLKLLAHVFKLPSPPNIDHLYCNLVGFPDASQNIRVAIWGYEGGRQDLDHWVFSYNLTHKEAFIENPEAARNEGSPLKPFAGQK